MRGREERAESGDALKEPGGIPPEPHRKDGCIVLSFCEMGMSLAASEGIEPEVTS
jgi:hypothetical protein